MSRRAVTGSVWTTRWLYEYGLLTATWPCGGPHRRHWSIMFFGSDHFSVETLKALHRCCRAKSCGVDRLEVCCSPPKHKRLSGPVQEYAQQQHLEVHPWPAQPLAQGQFDLGVVASFGHLIPGRVIRQFPLGVLNVHASLLPRWRGASPVAHAILHGDDLTGVSIMQIQPKHFDVGPILATESVELLPDEMLRQVEHKLSIIGAQLLVKVLDNLPWYSEHKWAQDESCVTYAPRLSHEHFEVKWHSHTASQIYNQWRALSQLSKLYSVWLPTGVTVHFEDIIPPDVVLRQLDLSEDLSTEPGSVHVLQPRPASSAGSKWLCIKCKEGWVAFSRFYYGPKRGMTAADFINGFVSKNKSIAKFGRTYPGP